VPACLPIGLAGFLLRLVAYFQGAVSNYPRLEDYRTDFPTERSVTVIDTSLDDSREPLQRVRMNRHLTRRLRWLIRRGRAARSGEMRIATANNEARCKPTPGQFNEHCIRVQGHSRTRIYGFGLGCRALRYIAIYTAALQGNALCLGKTDLCSAPISPD